LQALIHEHDHDLTEAKNLHDRAVRLRTHESAGYQLGAYRLDQIQTEMAADTKTLLQHPDDETASRSMGELWLELGFYDLAQPLIGRLDKMPGTCEDHVNMARILLATGKSRDALLVLKQKASCARRESVDGILALATQLEVAKQYADAEQCFIHAYNDDPKNTWNDFVSFLRRRGRPREALPYAQLAAKRDSDDTDALNAVASVEFELGRLGTAELWFKRALATYMNNSEALVGLARIAGKRGQWSQARDSCGDAVKGNSWDNFDGWVCLGDAEDQLGQPQQALMAYQNASWLRPRDEALYSKIERLYSKLSDVDRAAFYGSFAKSPLH
jgi:tetratricopeptide (TPR) repeat protein